MRLAVLLIALTFGFAASAADQQTKAKSESRELVLPDLSQAQKQLDERQKKEATITDACQVNNVKQGAACPSQNGTQMQFKEPSAFDQGRSFDPSQQSTVNGQVPGK